MNYKEKYYKYKEKYYQLLNNKSTNSDLLSIGGSSRKELIDRYRNKYSPEEKQQIMTTLLALNRSRMANESAYILPNQLSESVVNFTSELQISEQKIKNLYVDHLVNYNPTNSYDIFLNLKKPDLSEPYILNLLEKGLQYKLQESVSEDEIKLKKIIFNVPENIILTVEESLYDNYNLYIFELIPEPIIPGIIPQMNEKIYVDIYEIGSSWKESPGIIENFY